MPNILKEKYRFRMVGKEPTNIPNEKKVLYLIFVLSKWNRRKGVNPIRGTTTI